MAKPPFDPYTPDLFENLLPLSDAQELDGMDEESLVTPQRASTVHKAIPFPIEDFGEKIGGAKKDLWRGFAQDLQLATTTDFINQPLSKVWPIPNYQRLVEEGVNTAHVAFVRVLRESIPTKPKSSYKVRSWVTQAQSLRNLCVDILSGNESLDHAKKILLATPSLAKLTHKMTLYEMIGHEHSLAHYELGLHSYSRYQGVDYQPAKLLWVFSEKQSKTSWPKELLSADSCTQLMDLILEKRESWLTKDIESSRTNPAFIIFSERLERYKSIPALRRVLNEERIGQDYRQGVDVTPEVFTQAFGFKGVEFGNWVEQSRRQVDLNNAFDALMDLAKVTDLPPKALSLNGQLSLAFGARGSGGVHLAAAHYESDHVVINLTKNQGAGSLAHEWWHALDHYFSRENGQALGFMTNAVPISASTVDRLASNANIRPEVFKAFSQIVDATLQSPFAQRSAMLDQKRVKEYWSTRIELSARAFEAYVIAKLDEQGIRNDYLANIVTQAQWDASSASSNIQALLPGTAEKIASHYPYPTPAELFAVNEDAAAVSNLRSGSIGRAFDVFFQTIDTSVEHTKVKVFCTREDPQLKAFEKLAYAVRPSGGLTPGVELATPGAGLVFGPLVTQEAIRSAMENQFASLNQQMLHPIAFTLETNIRSAFPSMGEGEARLVKGATFGDRIYLFTDAATSELDIQRTIFHELLHYGVRRYLSRDEFISSKTQLYERDRNIKLAANDWINKTTEGQEALAHSGRAYAIARGVDEALASLAEDKSAWVMHLRQQKPSQWQALAKGVVDWSANLAQRIGLSQFAAYLRSKTNTEAINFIDSLFDKFQVDAAPSPDPFKDDRYALKRAPQDMPATSTLPPAINPTINEIRKEDFMARIADKDKPPYVDFIPFYLELPVMRQGDGPLWDPALTPPDLIAATQNRFGTVREFVVPQKNGGPYQGECYQIDEHFLAQEIGPRLVTVHRLAHMETRSAAVAYQLPMGLDSVYLSIDYHGTRAQVYPFDPQKNQFIEVCKTVENTMRARGVSTRDQSRFKSMWRVSCEDVMRARMGWQRARDVVGPRYKTPGILDPVYQNLYSPVAVPSPHRPNTPASDPNPLGVPVNLQTTYFPRSAKPAAISTSFIDNALKVASPNASAPSSVGQPFGEPRRSR